jgi:flagellar biosynthesis GTPase FlhF
VPLKTYRGPAAGPLLAQAEAELGPEAVVIRTEQNNGLIELLAADPETAAAVTQLMAARPSAAPASSSSTAPAAGPSPEAVRAATRAWPFGRPEPAAPARRDVIAVVGPTGAGKTTAVAKLAGHPRLWGGRRVGLIGLDTYRVGAVDQLAAYAAALGTPLETVYQASDLARATRRLERCGVLLIDCPGRGPRAQRDAENVRELVLALGAHEIHLALPAGMQREVAARLLDHHLARGVTHLLATKVDEVPDDWTLFDLAAERRLPMRWLSDGQRVPQDLRSAAPRLEAAQASARGRRTASSPARRATGAA